MALALTAEQKSVLKIFKIEEQYVVPSYQRPYSWEYDQCFQLYNDILRAFESNEDYFLGNVIIAKSENNNEFLEVVDGQQRLITLLIFIKILSLFQSDLKILFQILSKEDWKGNNNIPRIRTEVFESNDSDALNRILDYELINFENLLRESTDKSNKIIDRKIKDKFIINSLYFYQWIKFYNERNNNIEELTSYLLRNTFLLPIELGGKTQDEANEKALVIFETINNRGMNLEDADIFKAKLFNKAKKINEDAIFIDLWADFKVNCDNLNMKIDDVFRYYSHIIRGKEGITYSEKNLREFFTRENFSPFELNNYKNILDDLFKILEILEFLNKEKIGNSTVARWLQILELYTNQYPRYAIVNYLFVNGFNINSDFDFFLKSLLRFVYYQGSTSTIKFEIYNIIKQVSLGQKINSYRKDDIPRDFFDYLGRLKRGFALLAYYLQNDVVIPYYFIDRIITLKDVNFLGDDWDEVDTKDVLDNIANYLVIDVVKKSLPFERKLYHYLDSGNVEMESFIRNGFKFSDFRKRQNHLTDILYSFFSGLNEKD